MKWDSEVRVLRANITTKRILVTSDIHGDLDGLKALLAKMAYAPGEDALVIIGDMVQKGTKNLDTVRYVMELAMSENVFILMGNNDLFTLEGTDEELLTHAREFPGRSVLGEMAAEMGLPFPADIDDTRAIREKAAQVFVKEMDFLRGLPHILETEKFLFAHAGLTDENLERQELEYVLAAPRFHETVTHTFSKTLLVGHWPASNYRTDGLNYAPLYSEAHNVLSIDGGTNLKSFGQLNGVILDNETGSWDWVGVDNFPKIRAEHAQSAGGGTCIVWPDNSVELIERGDSISRCRAMKNGVELDIPNEFLFEEKDGLRCSDMSDIRLGVRAGETLSVLREFDDRLLVKNDHGEVGFWFKRS